MRSSSAVRCYEVLLSNDKVLHLWADRFEMDEDWTTFWRDGEGIIARFNTDAVYGVIDMVSVLGSPPPEITADDAKPAKRTPKTT